MNKWIEIPKHEKHGKKCNYLLVSGREGGKKLEKDEKLDLEDLQNARKNILHVPLTSKAFI